MISSIWAAAETSPRPGRLYTSADLERERWALLTPFLRPHPVTSSGWRTAAGLPARPAGNWAGTTVCPTCPRRPALAPASLPSPFRRRARRWELMLEQQVSKKTRPPHATDAASRPGQRWLHAAEGTAASTPGTRTSAAWPGTVFPTGAGGRIGPNAGDSFEADERGSVRLTLQARGRHRSILDLHIDARSGSPRRKTSSTTPVSATCWGSAVGDLKGIRPGWFDSSCGYDRPPTADFDTRETSSPGLVALGART